MCNWKNDSSIFMVAITIIQLCKKMCIAFIEERWHHCGGSSVISTTVFGSENSSGLNLPQLAQRVPEKLLESGLLK